MRHCFKILVVLFVLSFSPLSARADLWQGAPTQRPSQLTLLAAPQLYFSPTELQGFFGASYGLSSKLQLEGRLGVGTLPAYIGAFGKYHLFSSDAFSLSGWGGFHVQDIFNLDAALIFGYSFRTWDLYLAPLIMVQFASGRTFLGVGFTPGFSLFLAHNIKLYVEATISVDQLYNAASAGFRFFL